MDNIFIVRHGETNLNFEECYQGLANIQLNTKGISQANSLGSYFNSLNIYIDAIISSPLLRSLETMNILVSHILKNQNSINIEVSNDLKEVNFGDFDGMKKKKVLHSYANFFSNNIYGYYTDYEKKFPNGESLEDVYSRINNFFNKYDINRYNNVIVICHNGVNKMLRAYLTNSNPKDYILIDQKHNEIIKISKNNLKQKSIKI